MKHVYAVHLTSCNDERKLFIIETETMESAKSEAMKAVPGFSPWLVNLLFEGRVSLTPSAQALWDNRGETNRIIL